MQDSYYLERSVSDTDSVIIIANYQLRDTPAYLYPFY